MDILWLNKIAIISTKQRFNIKTSARLWPSCGPRRWWCWLYEPGGRQPLCARLCTRGSSPPRRQARACTTLPRCPSFRKLPSFCDLIETVDFYTSKSVREPTLTHWSLSDLAWRPLHKVALRAAWWHSELQGSTQSCKVALRVTRWQNVGGT